MTTSPPANGDTKIEVAYPATLARRIGAMLYDALLLFGIWLMTLLILVFIRGEAATGLWVQLLLLAEAVGFFVYCWVRQGQTLGMMAWRLKVLTPSGHPPNWQAALIRILVAPLSFACLGIGYLWQWFDAEQRSWHDRASGTLVVHIPKTA